MKSFSESFRCGVFFAGKELKDKPFQKLFIIPKRFPINQTYFSKDEDAPKRYSDHGHGGGDGQGSDPSVMYPT